MDSASAIDSYFTSGYSLFGLVVKTALALSSPRFRPIDSLEDIFAEIWIKYEILDVFVVGFHVIRSPFPLAYDYIESGVQGRLSFFEWDYLQVDSYIRMVSYDC